jgi:hypothetical protein
MSNIPKDAVILLSYINTQLRDSYSSLEDLCLALDLCQKELEDKLKDIDYVYEEIQNQFI